MLFRSRRLQRGPTGGRVGPRVHRCDGDGHHLDFRTVDSGGAQSGAGLRSAIGILLGGLESRCHSRPRRRVFPGLHCGSVVWRCVVRFVFSIWLGSVDELPYTSHRESGSHSRCGGVGRIVHGMSAGSHPGWRASRAFSRGLRMFSSAIVRDRIGSEVVPKKSTMAVCRERKRAFMTCPLEDGS